MASDSSSHDSGPRLLQDIWGIAAVGILIVILRMIAKLRIRQLGWDDALMACPLVCGIRVSPSVLTPEYIDISIDFLPV